MEFAFDLHIHTALSPCADDDMTPNNIVNMALLKGLDIIAITDHNSCDNIEAVMAVGRQNGLMVIPGMEVQTKEEIHVLCLFRRLEAAMAFGQLVYSRLPNIPNNEGIFGRQLKLNSNDETVGREERLLLSSTDMSINEVFEQVNILEGICIPAHVDRAGFGIITNLGFIPPDIPVSTIEVSNKNPLQRVLEKYPFLEKYQTIISSDAHYLWDINERKAFIDLEYLSINAFLNKLSKP